MLVNYADRSLHVIVVHTRLAVAGRRLAIGARMIDACRLLVWHLLCIYRRNIFVRSAHLLLHRHLLLIIVISASTTFVFYPIAFVALMIRREVALIVDGWGYTMEFEPDTCRTWPCVGCCRVALDLPSPTPLASPHH